MTNVDIAPPLKFRAMKKIPYSDEFSAREIRAIQTGIRPSRNKDRWLIIFEKNRLNFHRAKTGDGIYQIRIKTKRDGSGFVKWAKGCKDVNVINKRYEAEILAFLVSNLILDGDVPFPRHKSLEESRPGEFQFELAGTDYPEEIIDNRKLKQLYK
ncbi:MAG: hypothetical protein HKN36_00010 [Hellea sp.]|nr:hypothetical protein [Hellea sp.]